ncbi:MAG TPA: c-type cytochrome [Gaiellaceae bacterium]|nr:c-type cytochrome [Gaiellaceae bacterium]
MRLAKRVLGGLALGATAAAALFSAGCGTGGMAGAGGDTTHGKDLFVQKCGSCHTLADAGTQGKVGPDLDDAFSGPRAQGFKESSIRNIVRDQILFPVSSPSGVTKGPNGEEQPVQGMPANLVTGQDAKDVAAYVASVAGVSAPGGGTSSTTTTAPPPPPPTTTGGTSTQTTTEATTTTGTTTQGTTTQGGAGGGELVAQGKHVFETAGCTSCHTLADAGASGTVGPNLDDAKPPKSLVIDRVTNGKGVMPSFKGQLTSAEIEAVATYVSSVAGK